MTLEASLEELVHEVVAGSRLSDSYDHGERHWRAVALAGLELLRDMPAADPEIVVLFLFHDARRENEYHDPEHGLRGAELARELGFDSDILYFACRDHTDGEPTADPTIGICWDASGRTSGGRDEPLPRYMNSGRTARRRRRDFDMLQWPEIMRGYGALT